MVTQAKLLQLNMRVSQADRQRYKSKANACDLSLSEYLRLLLESDQAAQVQRDQRIACLCRQLVRNLAALKVTPNLHESNLFTDSIALVEQIQQEVRGS